MTTTELSESALNWLVSEFAPAWLELGGFQSQARALRERGASALPEAHESQCGAIEDDLRENKVPEHIRMVLAAHRESGCHENEGPKRSAVTAARDAAAKLADWPMAIYADRAAMDVARRAALVAARSVSAQEIEALAARLRRSNPVLPAG